MGSIKRSSAAIAGAKFFLLNYVVISQMAMVVAGLASARANSAASVEISSVVVGSIPLITSCALLLHNAASAAGGRSRLTAAAAAGTAFIDLASRGSGFSRQLQGDGSNNKTGHCTTC
jgi:hypothetical protein